MRKKTIRSIAALVLTLGLLAPGLCLPSVAAGYTVTRGDSLWSIAEKQLGSGKRWGELYEINRDSIGDPRFLRVGQILTLPGETAGARFASWNQEAKALQNLIAYVEAVTDPDSADFIPEKDRIAVYDMDGTLLCETSPGWVEWMMFFYTVLEDPDYQAGEELKRFAEKARAEVYAQSVSDETDAEFGRWYSQVYQGMTKSEFLAYAADFLSRPTEYHRNMTYADSFYLPMLEVTKYLAENGFTQYIVSGTDRETCRMLAKEHLGFEENHIIGSDSAYIAAGHGDEAGYLYNIDSAADIVRGPQLSRNLKMDKVSAIMREIGKQPVLAFGNTMGDVSMLKYTTEDNPYRSEGFLLLCDDTERDHGNLAKAEKVNAVAQENGWNAISMKNDFLTIYGSGVEYIQ